MRTPASCLALLLALLGSGCAAALHEPPPVSALQRTPAGSGSAPQLLEEAAGEYARRPDVAAVRRAEGLCLQAAQVDQTSAAGLVCAVQAKAWLADREKDVAVRTELAVSAVQAGQHCLLRDPASPACRFWLAIALGLQARDRHSTVEDGLKRMVALLREVARDAPRFEQGGADRVLSIILLKGPDWPLGPRDPEEALVRARMAVEIAPLYPPNLIALGEALRGNGDEAAAREALRGAVRATEKGAGSQDPDAPWWRDEARALLPSEER